MTTRLIDSGLRDRTWMRHQTQGTVVEAYRFGSISSDDWRWYVDAWNANYDAGRAFTRMTDAGTLYVPKETTR